MKVWIAYSHKHNGVVGVFETRFIALASLRITHGGPLTEVPRIERRADLEKTAHGSGTRTATEIEAWRADDGTHYSLAEHHVMDAADHL